MNHIYSFLLFFKILTGFNEEPELLTSLIRNAEEYNRSFPSEHVYIGTDRSYYKPGDELWFKAYVSNTLSNSEFSNDLNIKLVDIFGKEVLYLRYPLYNQTSSGYFVLPALLEEGKYYLIGYTGWMKNMPISELFSKEIIVSNYIEGAMNISVEFTGKNYYPGNQVNGKISVHLADNLSVKRMKYIYNCRSLKKNFTSGWGVVDEKGNGHFSFKLPEDIDSDFLWVEFKIRHKRDMETHIVPFPVAKKNVYLEICPEGGKLIAGLENRVAFKASDNQGMPVDIEGYLIDDQGNQLNKIECTYKGLGSFTFTPELKRYRIRLVKPLISGSYFSFPDIESDGIQLNHSGFKDGNILFTLRSPEQNKPEKVYFIVEQKAKIGWAALIEYQNTRLVNVPAGKFETGIIKCSVLDEVGSLIATRSVFLDKGPAAQELAFSALKNYYTKRERVILEYHNQGTNDLLANMTVINDKYIHGNELTMRNYFHFITELQGIHGEWIDSDISGEEIDLILMTHKTKSLPLVKLIRSEIRDPVPYYNHDGIRGQILNKKGNPVENAMVKIIHSLDLSTYQAESDSQGIFHIIFDNNVINYNFLTIAVANENGKTGSILKLFNRYSQNILENKAVNKEQWKYNQKVDLIKYRNPKLLYSGRYGQGRIKEKKATVSKGYDYERFSSFTSVLDVIKEIKDYKIDNREIFFTGRTSPPGILRGAVIVLDGIAIGTDIEILNQISPKEVRNITISTWPSDIQKYTALNSIGVIEISTIRGRQESNLSQIQEFQQDMLMIDHQFMVPDYLNGENPETDNRITLFWEPDMLIQKSVIGNVVFYTSDQTGLFKCILQGTDQHGDYFSKKIDINVR